jgi:hypothetical protein
MVIEAVELEDKNMAFVGGKTLSKYRVNIYLPRIDAVWILRDIGIIPVNL